MSEKKVSKFFKEKRDASEIKSEILNKYFETWAGIMLNKKKRNLLYVDLFSGPGIYDNGQKSTPIKILDSIYRSKGKWIDYDLYVQTIFNDKSKKIISKLKHNIESLDYHNELTNKPVIGNEIASLEVLNRCLNSGFPSLTFIDPLGYGYTNEMLISSVRNWGSDLFVLFNINRIRGAVRNYKVANNMYGIFDKSIGSIQDFYQKNSSAYQREQFIVTTFEKIFEDHGYKTLKFRINFPNKNQTSHYLYFVSKAEIAILRAKEIMEKYSDVQPDDVPLFGANIRQSPMFFPEICEFSIHNLKKEILQNRNRFEGLTIKNIYLVHNYKTNYINVNYKDAIGKLWVDGKLKVFKPNKQEIRDPKKITYTATVKFT